MQIKQMEPSFGSEELKAVETYLKSDGWLTEHKKTREFEQMIADYVGTKYCSVVSNGTVSLVSALLAFGIKPGDEVIVPDYTMGATAMAVSLIGAKPVFVDIEEDTLGVSFCDMRKKITDKTKALMLVGINGRFPYFGEEIIDFCRCEDIHVIEDSAQCLGSYHDQQHIGTFSWVGSFSFSMPKIISTGQGGCLVTDDKYMYEEICKIKNFGRATSGNDVYDRVGSNFKFTDLQAVIGIEQMKKLEDRVSIKKMNYMVYEDELFDVDGIDFIYTELKDTTPWMNDIILKSNKHRNFLMKFLAKKGIGTREFYPSMHMQIPYLDKKEKFPVSHKFSQCGLWLPSSITLKEKDIVYVCDSIKEGMKYVK